MKICHKMVLIIHKNRINLLRTCSERDAFKCSLRGREIQHSSEKAEQARWKKERKKKTQINFQGLQTDSAEYIND